MLGSLNIETASRKTQRTRQVFGIEAQETEVTLAMPLPEMPVEVRTAMSVSTAAPGETEKNPALAEIASHWRRAWEGTDITRSITSMLGRTPGGPAMAKLIESLEDAGFLLEMGRQCQYPVSGICSPN